jgi:hypothetical protein
MGKLDRTDDGEKRSCVFEAPKTQVMALIVNTLGGSNLRWDLILVGAMIAVTLELAGISSLTFAVGVYVPIQYSTPIFLGGLIRWLVDKRTSQRDGTGTGSEVENIVKTESSPGVLLASGYIAGGSLAGVLIAFCNMSDSITKTLSQWQYRKHIVTQEAPLDQVLARMSADELGLAAPPDAPKAPLNSKDVSPDQKKQLDLWNDFTNKKSEIAGLNKEPLTTYYEIGKGTSIALSASKDRAPHVVAENTRLGKLVDDLTTQKVTITSDELLDLNPTAFRPPLSLPKDAELRLPQKIWPSIVAFALLSFILIVLALRPASKSET